MREPNDIQSYAALACIAIQANQNYQHGGQSIPNFDYGMAAGVAKTYKKHYRANIIKAAEMLCEDENISDKLNEMFEKLKADGHEPVFWRLITGIRHASLSLCRR